MKQLLILYLLFSALTLNAQSLFEDALDNSKTDETSSYEMNGYVRGVFYAGKKYARKDQEMKSGYGEAALKLKVRKGDVGDAYAEVRFRNGAEYNRPVEEATLREAYVNAYLGRFDVRIGQQIVVWGRADGFNPTNNLTPFNYLTRSPNEDDKRVSNFLMRGWYNLDPIRLEFVWAPHYKSVVLPFGILPVNMLFPMDTPVLPDARLENGAIGLKANLEFASFDGSVSYFNGYAPMPGLNAKIDTQSPTNIFTFLQAFRERVWGADFSTTIGSFGLRGELGYRTLYDNYDKKCHVPNPDVQYVIGLDRTFGDLSLLLQYMGRYVLDFVELQDPMPISNPTLITKILIEQQNRRLAQQLYQTSHSMSGRASLSFFYDTMMLDVFGMFNFTSDEYMFRPKLSYELTDALEISVGGEYYGGPDETLYGMFGEVLSAGFVELKVSF